ncbi:MAG: TetR/AcrR family transcriptional regulator [Actinomycetota bacterium]|jgi:AcrR family transcriptional regulator|nr:TetR/AcrR family transcriptional regulator [Actinomycetota bacterium]
MARPTAADHDDKAAAVLAAAGRVFAERGYEGATMADVAREAGFSKAGVYHYFASKEHLLHGLLQLSLEQVLGDLCRADPGPGSPARLSALFEAYLRSFTTHLRVITPLLLRLDLLRPPWREEVKTLERRIVDRLADAIGTVDSTLSPRTLAFLALGAANWTYYWYDPEGDVSVDDLARGAATLFTGAVPR